MDYNTSVNSRTVVSDRYVREGSSSLLLVIIINTISCAGCLLYVRGHLFSAVIYCLLLLAVVFSVPYMNTHVHIILLLYAYAQTDRYVHLLAARDAFQTRLATYISKASFLPDLT